MFKDDSMYPVPNTDGYFVTTYGEVYSLKTTSSEAPLRKVSIHLNSNGYPSVNMRINKQFKKIPVHVIVAKTFLGDKPSNNHEVRHLDGSRTNNYYLNLKWGTKKENAADRDKHGRLFKGVKNAKLNTDQVKKIKCLINSKVKHSDIAKQFGVCRSLISSIGRGEYWKNVTI